MQKIKIKITKYKNENNYTKKADTNLQRGPRGLSRNLCMALDLGV